MLYFPPRLAFSSLCNIMQVFLFTIVGAAAVLLPMLTLLLSVLLLLMLLLLLLLFFAAAATAGLLGMCFAPASFCRCW